MLKQFLIERYKDIKYFIKLSFYITWMLKWTIIFTSSMLVIILVTGYLGGANLLDLHNLVQILLGEYSSTNIMEDIMLFFVLSFQLFPIWAFLEVKTVSKEDKIKLRINMMENHIIIAGSLDHIAHRAGETLDDLDIGYVFIISPNFEEKASAEALEYFNELDESGTPMVRGLPTSKTTLRAAGIKKARGIIITGNDELENVVIAKKAKEINPKIKTVMRVFREQTMDIYEHVADEYISSSKMTHLVYVLGVYLDLATQYPPAIKFNIHKNSPCIGKKRSFVEKKTKVTILGVLRDGEIIRADEDIMLEVGDDLFIYADVKNLKNLINWELNSS